MFQFVDRHREPVHDSPKPDMEPSSWAYSFDFQGWKGAMGHGLLSTVTSVKIQDSVVCFLWGDLEKAAWKAFCREPSL